MGVVGGVHTGEAKGLKSGQACPMHLPGGVRWKRVKCKGVSFSVAHKGQVPQTPAASSS